MSNVKVTLPNGRLRKEYIIERYKMGISTKDILQEIKDMYPDEEKGKIDYSKVSSAVQDYRSLKGLTTKMGLDTRARLIARLSDDQKDILERIKTQSDKVRYLDTIGFTTKEIHQMLQIRYQAVRNALYENVVDFRLEKVRMIDEENP